MCAPVAGDHLAKPNRGHHVVDDPSGHLLLLVRFALTFSAWALLVSGVKCLSKAEAATRCGVQDPCLWVYGRYVSFVPHHLASAHAAGAFFIAFSQDIVSVRTNFRLSLVT